MPLILALERQISMSLRLALSICSVICSHKLHSETVSKKNKRSVCLQVAIAFSHLPSCISIINSAFVIYFWEKCRRLDQPRNSLLPP